jgi:anti-sigma regulatory factor (Ser/Thr protein kinase)
MTEIEDRLHLPPEAASAGVARRFVAAALHGCNVDLTLVSLLVSELVSNAVLHARTPLEVVVQSRGDYVRITVSDESPALPAMKAYAPDAVTGRGLTMVDTAAARWGVDELSSGKAVWFELPLAQAVSHR